MAILGLAAAAVLLVLGPAAVADPQSKGFSAYVSASLTDKNGLFIEDLGAGEVEVLEDGQPRKIEFMASNEVPTAYGILFDRAMMGESPDVDRRVGGQVPSAMAARNVAYELIDKQLGKQALWVGYYDKELHVALDFSSDAFAARQSIQEIRGVRNPPDSFLYAGLFGSVQRMNERHERRRVLILFLEDVDTATLDKLKPLKNLLAVSNLELFCLRFGSRTLVRLGQPSPQMSESALRELSAVTAGETFVASTYGEHMEDFSRRVYNHIRTFYTLGFQAGSSRQDPGRLQIRCSRPGSKIKTHPLVPVLP